VPLFAELFAEFAAGDPGWEWTAADRHGDGDDDDLRWPFVRVRGELALICTSTSRATPWFTAYGRVGAGQLARLKRVLCDPRLADKVRVLAIHHPPAGKRARNRIRGLRDHEAFAAVIAEAGAHLIVHGHEHRDMTEALTGPGGPVPVRGVASGTFFDHRPKNRERLARYRIYEIADGKVASDCVRVWDRERRAFVPESSS
jgi:3',5'-cyclic AMP phosphodiesterase CpdA